MITGKCLSIHDNGVIHVNFIIPLAKLLTIMPKIEIKLLLLKSIIINKHKISSEEDL